MAYTRRRRRTYRKKKSPSWAKYVTPSNAVKAAGVAQAAWRGVQMLKGLVNSERMYNDRTLTLGSNRSLMWGLTLIPQGDDVGNRTGNSILVRSFYMRGYLQANPSITGNTRISLVLLQDLQQVSDTTPGITDVFEQDDPDSMIKKTTAGRYKILWRKNYTLFPQAAGQSARDLQKYFKLYSHVRYNGSSASDIQKGGYYLAMLSSESTNFPTISLTSRIGYHDN